MHWENCTGDHMTSPAYHRRQAEFLTRISKKISNVDAAALLLRRAAQHRTLADERERHIQQQQHADPIENRDWMDLP